MMFSRAAPAVLFTAFCLAVAGSYVAGERNALSRPGQMSDAEFAVMDAYYNEMRLALQVGDDVRFDALLQAQIAQPNATRPQFTPDTLPAPYQALRRALMDEDVAAFTAWRARHPGLDLNAPQGRYAAVPLIWATSNFAHMPALLQALIEAGADPLYATPRGRTVMHAIASPFHHYETDAQIDRALDLLPPQLLTQADRDGVTPLHASLGAGHPALALALLSRDADPNAPYPALARQPGLAGLPPLLLAGGDPQVIEALLFAGADPQARDPSGRRIIDVVWDALSVAEADLQERVNASAAEEYDREYVAGYRRAHAMIRAALDARLAQGHAQGN